MSAYAVGGFKLFLSTTKYKGRRQKNGYFTVRLTVSVDLPPPVRIFLVCVDLRLWLYVFWNRFSAIKAKNSCKENWTRGNIEDIWKVKNWWQYDTGKTHLYTLLLLVSVRLMLTTSWQGASFASPQPSRLSRLKARLIFSMASSYQDSMQDPF